MSGSYLYLIIKYKYEYTKIHVDVNLVHNDRLNIDTFKKSSNEYKNAEFILEKE